MPIHTPLPTGTAVLPPERQPPVKLRHRADGIEIWRTHFPELGSVPQHVHRFDHLSMISAGAVRVWADGQDLGVVRAPDGLTIRAGVAHRFDILEPGTIVDCIHNVSRGGAIELAARHEFGEAA